MKRIKDWQKAGRERKRKRERERRGGGNNNNKKAFNAILCLVQALLLLAGTSPKILLLRGNALEKILHNTNQFHLS